jgi:hypothetical protein
MEDSMRKERLTRTLLTGVLSLLMVAVVLPAGLSGQDDQQQSEESQKSLDKLQYRFGVLKDRVEYLEEELEEQKSSQEESDQMSQMDFRPGYERAEGYMQPGRAEEFNLRVGRAGPMDFYMGLDTVGRMQALDHSDAYNGTKLDDVSPDFQKAHGNISFLAAFNDDRENKDPYLEVYLNWLISSRHHGEMYGDQGYMLLSRLPDGPAPLRRLFDYVDVKAGEYELPFGDHIYRRTNNADVQQNALIGNSVADGRAVETGVTVMNDSPSSEPGKINWLLNVSSGDPTPSFESGNGLAVLPKVWANLSEELRLSLSAYRVDQSGNPGGYPDDTSNLYTGLRDTGGVYTGILGGGNDSGQVLFSGGQDVTAVQSDLTFTMGQFELYGNVGFYNDEDTNGSDSGQPTEEWLYGTIEGVYNFTDRIYAAARYSNASADELVTSGGASSVDSAGRVDRIQIGGGYWITDTILAKLEYVHQDYSGFDSSERQVSGIDSWRDPSFDGVIGEVSFSF